MGEKFIMDNDVPTARALGDRMKHVDCHSIGPLCAVYGCRCVGYEAEPDSPPTPERLFRLDAANGDWVTVTLYGTAPKP